MSRFHAHARNPIAVFHIESLNSQCDSKCIKSHPALQEQIPLNSSGSPSWEEARRMRSSSATGFCVGCLPNFFSQGSGGLISQTDFICLPRLVSFMSL